MQQDSIRRTGRDRGTAGARDSRREAAGEHPERRHEAPRRDASRGHRGIAVIGDGKADMLRLPAPAPIVGRWIEDATNPVVGGVAQIRRAGKLLLDLIRGDGLVEADGIGLAARLRHSLKNELRTGLRVLLAALVIGGGWATLVPISGAVVLPGSLIAESNIKKIQHPTGGVVAGILVHDGMRVHAGDVLVRLDDTQVRANFQVIGQQLDEIKARIARLMAERDDSEELAEFRATAPLDGDKDAQLRKSETSLFRARGEARRSQRELLRNRIGQLNEEIKGMDGQISAKQTQSELIARELEGVQTLYDKHLTPLSRLTSLQREAARLEGERQQLSSSVAETLAKISESELQLVRLDQDFHAEVMKDLREAQDKEAELSERAVAAQDQLNRIDLRAPTSGMVHQLSIHTVGGVVAAGEIMMVIVPESDELQIDARLPANEIDQVSQGQSTVVRLSAFNQQTTPELRGTVSHVSADTTRDPQSNASYYTIRISLPGRELRRLGGLQLISGMPAEVFIQSGSRTMMSYLFKPISDQLHRMFRER